LKHLIIENRKPIIIRVLAGSVSHANFDSRFEI
jgi:hypothetical protein